MRIITIHFWKVFRFTQGDQKRYTNALVTYFSPAKALSLLLGHPLPRSAPDKNKSILIAVLRFRIHNSLLVENASYKSSTISLQSIFPVINDFVTHSSPAKALSLISSGCLIPKVPRTKTKTFSLQFCDIECILHCLANIFRIHPR